MIKSTYLSILRLNSISISVQYDDKPTKREKKKKTEIDKPRSLFARIVPSHFSFTAEVILWAVRWVSERKKKKEKKVEKIDHLPCIHSYAFRTL